MEPREWTLGHLKVILRLGTHEDKDMDAMLKADNIPLGASMMPSGTSGGAPLDLRGKEASDARRVEYWPQMTIHDPKRRLFIYKAVAEFLESAHEMEDRHIGISTLGPEIGMIPAWEISEEVAKAIYYYAQNDGPLESVEIVTTTASQFNSFVFTLNNIEMFVDRTQT